MKITGFKIEPLMIKLKAPVVLSYGTISEVESIILQVITDSGIAGYGEASTIAFVTGETPASIKATLKLFEIALLGQDALAIGKVHAVMDGMINGNSAAKCAVDLALYDIMGKVLGQPLYKLLGGYSNSFTTDVYLPIDTPANMAKEAVNYVGQGFTAFKIKAGKDFLADIEAAKKIREAVGKNIVLRIDANQGWTVTDTLKVAKALEDYDIEAIEQPVPYWDIEGMAEVKRKIGQIKLIADESVHTPFDAIRLVRANAADMFSIKLAKSGGIYKALQINAIAQSSGLECMLGCMIETGISISAAAHLKAAQKNIVVGDIDAVVLVDEPRVRCAFLYNKSQITLTDTPGLGVEVDI